MTRYTLTRSKRKTIAIYIRGGGVEVRAPIRASKRDIDRFVTSKELWIKDKLAASIERQAKRESFTLTYGDSVAFRGAQFLIAPREGARAGFDEDHFYMPPGLAPDQIKATCVRIYRVLAKRHLTSRVEALSERMAVAPTAVKINRALTRWGSCSAKKSLNFSWRLIQAPDDVIDYVVVHELAHIKELNHSPRFWAIVEGVMPEYREQKAKLKILHKKLSVEDWG